MWATGGWSPGFSRLKLCECPFGTVSQYPKLPTLCAPKRTSKTSNSTFSVRMVVQFHFLFGTGVTVQLVNRVLVGVL